MDLQDVRVPDQFDRWAFSVGPVLYSEMYDLVGPAHMSKLSGIDVQQWINWYHNSKKRDVSKSSKFFAYPRGFVDLDRICKHFYGNDSCYVSMVLGGKNFVDFYKKMNIGFGACDLRIGEADFVKFIRSSVEAERIWNYMQYSGLAMCLDDVCYKIYGYRWFEMLVIRGLMPVAESFSSELLASMGSGGTIGLWRSYIM